MHREAQQFSQFGSVSTTLDFESGVHALAGAELGSLRSRARVSSALAGIVPILRRSAVKKTKMSASKPFPHRAPPNAELAHFLRVKNPLICDLLH
jgi:hypothetical protein